MPAASASRSRSRPSPGIDAETLGALAGTLADAAPERATVQVIHWASPRYGAALDAWAAPRGRAGPVQARMAERRTRLLGPAGWRALHPGGPPFTLADYRVFVCAALAGPPGPAAETALGAFRRALEGTLASAGAQARRLEPDALLSLAAELAAPDMGGERDGGCNRPRRRWSPRDPLHLQCAAPGRALTVTPAGLVFPPPRWEPRRRPRRRVRLRPRLGRRGGAGAVGGRLPRSVAGLAR